MSGSFLAKSRHQTTFHFRRKIPADLTEAVGRSHIVLSLRTQDRRSAAVKARAAATRTDLFYDALRHLGIRFGTATVPNLSEYSARAQQLYAELRSDLMNLDHSRLMASMHQYKLRLVTERLEEQYEQELLAERQKARIAAQELAKQQAKFESTEKAIALREARILTVTALTTSAAAPSPRAKWSDKTISEVWNAYKAERISAGAWKDAEDTAKYDHLPHVRAMIEVISDKPIRDISADDINSFQTHVLNDPKGGSPRNRDKRLTRAGAVLRWAKSKRMIDDDFSDLFRYPGKIEQKSYVAFDQNDLKTLFESKEYRQHLFKTPSEFWLPLLGLHTGARLNELCQLTTTDIGEQDDIATISILDEDETKRLKTTASRRIVPIHSTLIELGFLDYVATIKAGRIFPELPDNPARRGDYTKEPTRKFTKYRRELGIGSTEGRSNKSFHSFRSTFISALRKAEVPGDRRRRLVGHEASDVHDRNYHGGDVLAMFEFSTLKADIECVQFNVDFTPFRHPNIGR